jgi:predicted RNA-binding protein YlqC (UPF0109 family)
MDAEYVEGDINTIDSEADELEEHEAEEEVDEAGEEPQAADADVLPEEVLTYLARSLASDPDAVLVEAEDRRGQLRLSLRVGPGDMGRVIGRRGRTAQAIRALVAVAGARSGVATSVDIVDD